MNSIHHLRGIIFALVGFTIWVFVDALIKLAAEAHLPPFEIIGALGFIGAVAMALYSLPRGGIKTLRPQNLRGQCFLALLSLAINYSNVIALKHLPLTLFYVAVFTAPMMMAFLASFFLHERLGLAKFLAILAGFGGVVVAIAPWQNASGGDAIGYLTAFAAAAFFASSMVLSRFLTRQEKPESMAFFNAVVLAIVGVAVFINGNITMPATKIILLLLVTGILNVTAILCSFLAVKYASAATVAPYHYTQIITGAFVAYFIWHDFPTLHLIAGAAIIVASGLYIAAHAYKTEPVPEVLP